MDDDALERRFDAVLALLLLNFVLLLGVAFRVRGRRQWGLSRSLR